MPKFMVDNNVGKLVRRLRMMGYDTLFFTGSKDSDMISKALTEKRVLLTRDTQIVKRRVVFTGQLKAILLESDDPELQMEQVVEVLNLDCEFRPFALCLECNQPLLEVGRQEVKDLVPAYVFKTQTHYRRCPGCRRIYWQRTHWQAMNLKLEKVR